MKKLKYLFVGAMSVLFAACGPTKPEPPVGSGIEQTQGKGGRFYNGVFKMNESEYIKSLFPHSIVDASSYRTASQIFEGLLKFDQATLKLKNGLAESYVVDDETKTVYTFKLKKGVMFQDNSCFPDGKGREFTAEDVKYCFTQLCTQSKLNKGFSSVMKGVIKGAEAHYANSENGTSGDIAGIKVIDKYTIQFILEEPSSIFPYYLAGPYCFIYAKESVDKYGFDVRVNPVGTGAFMIKNSKEDIEEDIKIILSKNQNYHGTDQFGNKLPLLDALEIRFVPRKRSEMEEFRQERFDMIYRLPSEIIIELLKNPNDETEGSYKEYQIQRQPEMKTNVLAFLNTDEIFSDINMRKAFSFAIDRRDILEYVLKGEGDGPGYNGITPNTFSGYNVDVLNGYSVNRDSALYYWSKTKYGVQGGPKLPAITLNVNPDGERNMEVAQEVQTLLKNNLNIDIKIEPLQRPQLVEKIMGGTSNFYRLGWQADYPHPHAFLSLFYGKNVPDDPKAESYPNVMRYKSSEFDDLYEKGLAAATQDEAFEFFLKAEQVLLDDCPFVVMWYDEGYRLLQPYVRNFPSNPMQYRDFSEVFFSFPKDVSKPKE